MWLLGAPKDLAELAALYLAARALGAQPASQKSPLLPRPAWLAELPSEGEGRWLGEPELPADPFAYPIPQDLPPLEATLVFAGLWQASGGFERFPGDPKSIQRLAERIDPLLLWGWLYTPPAPGESPEEEALPLPTDLAELLPPLRLWLVGGVVRDALLGQRPRDLDLVLPPSGRLGEQSAALGAYLQARLGGTLRTYPRYGTAELTGGALEVDLAELRRERYAAPGALPQVQPGTLEDDAARRDFTVSALYWEPPGRLLDFWGGREDLAASRLRLVHPFAFLEDPTRALRGARMAYRYAWSWPSTLDLQLAPALHPEVLRRVKPRRLQGELLLSLAEPDSEGLMRFLDERGLLAAFLGLTTLPPLRAPTPLGRLQELLKAAQAVN
jgi:hypothetical protein